VQQNDLGDQADLSIAGDLGTGFKPGDIVKMGGK
jgi:hypothetical protein